MNDTPSPYKYIGTNHAGQRMIRADLILLEGLSHCENPVTTEAILEIADPRNQARLDEKYSIGLLVEMMAEGYVERLDAGAWPGERLRWKITEKGRAHLIATEAQQIFEDLARCTHIRADRRPKVDPLTITEAPEPGNVQDMDLNARLRASHAKLDKDGIPAAAPASTLGEPRMQVTICDTQEPKLPAVATVCIGEDELDAWWDSLDVDQKADAFAGFALRMYQGESRIAVEPASIPILGTVGETAEEWSAIVDRVNGKQPAAAGGAQ